MGKIAEKIRADFLAHKDDRQIINIPEWNIDIYVGPWTWGQMILVQQQAEDGNIDLLREVIRIKAKKQDGTPAFDRDDIDEMRATGDPKLIRRIGTQILEAYPLSFDDEKKS